MRTILHLVRTLPESRVVPFVLVLFIATVTAHAWISESAKHAGHESFMVNVLIQVMPICLLKAKIVTSTNRLALLSRTASKLMFMHISVLTLRFLLNVSQLAGGASLTAEYFSPLDFWATASFLLSAVYFLSVVCEFQWTTVEFMTHTDIAVLHILGMVHAAIIQYNYAWDRKYRYDIQVWLVQYTNSMEVLAYMPALWMLSQLDQKLLAFEPLSQATSQRQAIWFLAWTMAFNIYEDGISTVMSGVFQPHFVAGHVAHFLVLLDFSSLFLQQAYNSKVSKNEGPISENLPRVT